mgnify:FL=1
MKLKNINKDALLRMRSHSLKRLARKTLILTSLTGLLIFNKDNRPLDNVVSKSTSPSFIPYENSNRKTKDDDVVNFGNQKVKEAVASRLGKSPEDPLTFGELKKITMLYLSDLDGPSELSDLKSLVNLDTLFLDNCYLNCIFLENNQELTRLFIIGGEITKSDKLPNTLTNVHMINAKCSDEVFSVPYYTEDLSIMSSYLNNLTLKNPESLKSLTYNSTSLLDLKSIASCTNLEEIDLSSSANIKNPSELFKFPNLAKVSLDDYAPIWLDADTYTKLKDSKIVHEPYDLRAECTYLDHVATNIKNSGSSSKERVAEVVKYIKGKYFYNKDLMGNNDDFFRYQLLVDYNVYPIETLTNKDGVVCINFATLYEALLNRLSIECYTLVSSDHAWNIYRKDDKLQAIDPTNLEQIPQLDDELFRNVNLKTYMRIMNVPDYLEQEDVQNYPIILKEVPAPDLGYLTKENNPYYEILYNNRNHIISSVGLLYLYQTIKELKKYYKIKSIEAKLSSEEENVLKKR